MQVTRVRDIALLTDYLIREEPAQAIHFEPTNEVSLA